MHINQEQKCSACGVCKWACPSNCIELKNNEYGELYPVIDKNKCIECGICESKCHINIEKVWNTPYKVFAAWSNEKKVRQDSASGGIAHEIYMFARENGYKCVGAVQQDDFSVWLDLLEKDEDFEKAKNSKYVYSSMEQLLNKIELCVKQNENIMFVGLPCQNAAVKTLYPQYDNILYVDLVCHGVTPYENLKSYLDYIQHKMHKNVEKMLFRDPVYDTSKYYLSLYNKKGECFYSKRTKDGDIYQVGYHRMISYRDNCYRCKYARKERVSDITLGDYKGLGKLKEWSYEKTSVSCVLVNTNKGEKFWEQLNEYGHICSYERPVDEPISSDSQLQFPCKKSEMRLKYEEYMLKSGANFVVSIKRVILWNKLQEYKRKLSGFKKKVFNKLKLNLQCGDSK